MSTSTLSSVRADMIISLSLHSLQRPRDRRWNPSVLWSVPRRRENPSRLRSMCTPCGRPLRKVTFWMCCPTTLRSRKHLSWSVCPRITLNSLRVLHPVRCSSITNSTATPSHRKQRWSWPTSWKTAVIRLAVRARLWLWLTAVQTLSAIISQSRNTLLTTQQNVLAAT